jgi:hypothetical protein
VVEVQHHDVAFVAVNAWVTGEVLDDDSSIALRIRQMKRISARVVYGRRFLVVFAKIRVLADLTVRRRAITLLSVEFVERLFFFTAWAKLHSDIVAFSCATSMALSFMRGVL